MKKALSLAISMLLMLSLLMTACEQPLTITLTAAKNNAKQGESIQLVSSLDGVTYEFTEGGESATVDENGLVTVNSDAEIGTRLKLVAKMALVESNTVEIEVVHTTITSLSNAKATIGTETVTIVAPEDEVTLSVTVSPSNATETVVWSIANGYEKATITGDKVTISPTAENGDQLILIASGGSKISNSIALTVNKTIPLASIELSATLTTVKPGQNTTLITNLFPSNATDKDIEWVLSGVSGVPLPNAQGVLSIPADILGEGITEAALTVVAKVGAISSEPLTITIAIPDTNIYIGIVNNSDMDNGTLIVRSRETHPVFLEISVTDYDTGKAVDEEVDFAVTSGQENIRLVAAPGKARRVEVLRHGDAEITVSLVNGGADPEVVQVKAIKAPSMLEMPRFISFVNSLGESELDAYHVGVGESEQFDFAVTVPQTNNDVGACADVIYKFEEITDSGMTGGASGSEVAEVVDGKLKDGKLTFKKQGTFRMTVESLAGDATNPEPLTQIFKVNDGHNISTWDELKMYMSWEFNAYLRPLSYTVNLVTTTSPMGNNNFDLVPSFVVSGYSAENANYLIDLYKQTGHLGTSISAEQAYSYHSHITALNRNITINGNNHPINFRGVRKQMGIIPDGVLDFAPDYETNAFGDGLINDDGTNIPTMSYYELNENTEALTFEINLFDLKMYGNIMPDGTVTEEGRQTENERFDRNEKNKLMGLHQRAITIGNQHRKSNFLLKTNNLELRNFHNGIKICRALGETDTGSQNKSIMQNTVLDEIYDTGIELFMSDIELNNLEVNFCGGVGINTQGKFSGMAGKDYNRNQTINITGNYKPGILNDGTTDCYLNYSLLGKSIDQLIALIFIDNDDYNQNQLSHIVHSGYSYMFAIFAFSDTPDDEQGAIMSLVGSQPAQAQALFNKAVYNTSVILFDGVNGYANLSTVSDTTKNTSNEFIEMDLALPLTLLGSTAAHYAPFLGGANTIDFGRIYMTNYFYNPSAA